MSWEKDNPEKVKASNKKYYYNNREEILKKHRNGTYKRKRNHKRESQLRKEKLFNEIHRGFTKNTNVIS